MTARAACVMPCAARWRPPARLMLLQCEVQMDEPHGQRPLLRLHLCMRP
jgi:hypothetical protein